MKKKEWLGRFPFRVGTTSYIIPDDILPNARFLAQRVQDIEIVIFDSDGYANLPDRAQIAELNALANDNELTYTVHLPLDLTFCAEGASDSARKALAVIERTLPLNPWAYILHLDSHALSRDPSDAERERWQAERLLSLRDLLQRAPLEARLSVENLESYPPQWNSPIIDQSACSECIDIGHLWVQGMDADAWLAQRLFATRVIHLHGVGERDHQSLRHQPMAMVQAVLRRLVSSQFNGVLTLEVFNQTDFMESLEIMLDCPL